MLSLPATDNLERKNTTSPNRSSSRATQDLGQDSIISCINLRDDSPPLERIAPSQLIEDTSVRDDNTDSASTQGNNNAISITQNWHDASGISIERVIDLVNDTFNTPSTSDSGVGDDSVSVYTIASYATAEEGCPLGEPMAHDRVVFPEPAAPVRLDATQEDARVSREKSGTPDALPLDASTKPDSILVDYQLARDNTHASSEDHADFITQMNTRSLDEPTPKIWCQTCQQSQGSEYQPSALKFGLAGEICIYCLQNSAPLTFVCCDETFPSQQQAKETAKAFLDGARPWGAAGLRFRQLARNKAAHFCIAYSDLPADGDTRTIAEAFFPGTSAEKRIVWVYSLAFKPRFRPYLAGYMAHEAGHIGAARHGFDEPGFKPVIMGRDNLKSVMRYHENPAHLVIQPSDIEEMEDMHNWQGDNYKGHWIRRIEPVAHVYSRMPRRKADNNCVLM
ncbi:hypothetical protein F5Y14DRAFT_208053 [Nemania sp. NC0429]|nr:hypothetical protein F5Y14DRAFT_208053 [Nemania sp. NC0429]